MVTALDMLRLGVEFGRAPNGKPTVRAPLDLGDQQAEELAADVRREVERRGALVTGRLARSRRAGVCDTCGDVIPAYRSGLCELCACARWRACEVVWNRQEGLGI